MVRPLINLYEHVRTWTFAKSNPEAERELRISIASHLKRKSDEQRLAILSALVNFIVVNHYLPEGHERCWENDRDLYLLLGLPFDQPMCPEDFDTRCREYRDRKMCSTGGQK